MHSLHAFTVRRLPAVMGLAASLAVPASSGAVPLTSSDGRTREFAVVVSADPAGLTVRESAGGRDIAIPWKRLDLQKTADANPWFGPAREKATVGGTVTLNLGLEPPPAAPAAAEWRTVKSTVAAGAGKNFTSLQLSAYVHREVETPRLALVWVGGPSPLAKRGDAADLARRMQGALVVADFQGDYGKAGEGSGEALVAGLTDLLKRARLGTAARGGGSGPAGSPGATMSAREKREVAGEAEGAGAPPAGPRPAGPAIILIGQGEPASFVWSLVCTRPNDVLAAVTIDGAHRAEANAGAFATPCLFLQSAGAPAGGDLTQPFDLWRHFSTDGSRWCHAMASADPLALAVAFARDVAAASPYAEALALLEDWENNALRHRIPMPVSSARDFREKMFRLATPDGASVFPVAAKTGAARNDLVWVPSPAFAAKLGGK